MNFRKLNNILGWVAFAIALFTYAMTVEPTASFWDCGEFIACAYKLQVPHPAGAPFFLLLGRLMSLFAAGNVMKVAVLINFISVISSAFTILFLFWTISILARKLINKDEHSMTAPQQWLVLGSAMVGSLVYAFSDTFWFSAVEAEVYALSSFFTAIVVWAAFKWEAIEDEAKANRWLLFIAYLVGLSIGVHLLNLVALPALALVYYYKRSKTISWRGGILAFLGGMVALAIVNSGVITGIPSIGFTLEKLFVNGLSMPYGTGLIFLVILLIGGLVYGIRWSAARGRVMLNTSLLAFAFILIGYSTYTIALIRSNYNPPINENDPSNVLNFISYLKREQYGSRPLLYGPVYSTKLVEINQGEPYYEMKDGKYRIYDYAPEYGWDGSGKMLLPRVWSSDPSHVAKYRAISGLPEGANPTMANNLGFMFQHQFGTMYWRYFLWNFWGRAGDIEGAGPTDIFEAKSTLPKIFASNKARTNFFGIPVILGVIGLLFQYFRRERDFLVVLLLFLFTGLALVVYLNSPPIEPRERDYIYVGSFYFFAIWIGLGVLGLAEWVFKFLGDSSVKSIGATVMGLAVPVLMVSQTWRGHDRSNRYHQVDFAKNLLNSCEKNAILFTGGDNDTFPLWYAQEVEGFRTDVRVCNLSLLGTEWYIEQMKRKVYESDPLPISFNLPQYNKGINDQLPFMEVNNENVKAGIDLKQWLELVKQKHPSIQMQISTGSTISTLPSKNLVLQYNPEQVKAMNLVPQPFAQNTNGVMAWTIGERDILKNDLIVLDIIAHNEWKRPIYFAGTLAQSAYLGMKPFMQLEGYAYRLLPVQVSEDDGFVQSDIMYNRMMNGTFWREMNNPEVYYDTETYLRVPVITARYGFLRLAEQLITEGKKDKAKQVLDKAMTVMPDKSIPYDQITANYAMFYYAIGDMASGNKIAKEMTARADELLNYFIPLFGKSSKQWGEGNVRDIIQMQMGILKALSSIHEQYNKTAPNEPKKVFDKYAAIVGM